MVEGRDLANKANLNITYVYSRSKESVHRHVLCKLRETLHPPRCCVPCLTKMPNDVQGSTERTWWAKQVILSTHAVC